jgi:hypothetical protein
LREREVERENVCERDREREIESPDQENVSYVGCYVGYSCPKISHVYFASFIVNIFFGFWSLVFLVLELR